MRFFHIFFILSLPFLGQRESSPIPLAVPYLAGACVGVVAYCTVSGAVGGAIAKSHLPLNNTRREQVVKAGALKGLVGGIMSILDALTFGLFRPVTSATGHLVASKVLKHPDDKKAIKTGLASGSVDLIYPPLPVMATGSGALKAAIARVIYNSSVESKAGPAVGAKGGLLGFEGTDAGTLFVMAEDAHNANPDMKKVKHA